jgi:hypothetical protein
VRQLWCSGSEFRALLFQALDPRVQRTNYECVLGQLLEETPLDCAVDEEVKSLGGDGERSSEQQGWSPHVCDWITPRGIGRDAECWSG